MKNPKKVSGKPRAPKITPITKRQIHAMAPEKLNKAFAKTRDYSIEIEIPLSRIAPNSIGLIRQALDAMTVALANHNHRWSARDRKSYEKAVKILAK